MRNQKIEKWQGKEEDEAEVNPDNTAKVTKLMVNMDTHNSKRMLTLGCRRRRSGRKGIFVKRIAQSGGFDDGV